MSTLYVNTIAPQSGTTVTVSNKFAVTGTMHAAGVASGSVAGPGSYIALNPSNQLVLTASAAGITQANQGNNRVITSVDADNINAEANLSFDGTDLTLAGNVSGSGTAQFVGVTTLGNNLYVTGAINPGAGGLMRSTPVLVPDSTTALTHNANGGRTNVIPDTGGDRVWTLPTPTAAGQHFHFIYGGAAIEAHDNYIKTVTDDDSVFFKGAIFHHSLNAMAPSAAKYSNGSSNSSLKIDNAAYLDLHFLSYSTTVWYIWGMVVSDTAPTFEDQGD